MSTAKDTRGDEAEAPTLDVRSWARRPAASGAPSSDRPDQRDVSPGAADLDVASWGRRARPEMEPDRPSPSRKRWGPAAAAALLLAASSAVGFGIWKRGDTSEAPAPPARRIAGEPPEAAAVTGSERRVLVLADVGSLASSLAAQGVGPEQAAAAQAAAARLSGAGELRMEVALSPSVDGRRSLLGVRLQRSDGAGLALTPARDGFTAEPLNAELRNVLRLARGQMDADSFYSSAVAAGVNDSLIPAFAQAFAFDFDFQREIKPGDVFEVAYEESVNARGESVGAKTLLYASLTTAEKSRALYRFKPAGQAEADWYDGAGRSVRRGLMRTPVEGARISSSFGWRKHPILAFQKLHKGTDFAAPTGTPVYASGDGVIQWAAMKGANGNLVILQHDTGWRTYYLHLNAFGAGVVPGARVAQGREIGQVGTTGRSTGPHLHYEVHIDGQAVDPMSLPQDAGRPLTGAGLAAFIAERDRIDALRASGL